MLERRKELARPENPLLAAVRRDLWWADLYAALICVIGGNLSFYPVWMFGSGFSASSTVAIAASLFPTALGAAIAIAALVKPRRHVIGRIAAAILLVVNLATAVAIIVLVGQRFAT